ncbi:MAG: acetolactate synthase small subunit [Christensenellaceae bacterium]|jgi:acetolactate synthase-1/3 small subunit|nr:acetolactate synthase small subunit [Christensenellaceae bacterium]
MEFGKHAIFALVTNKHGVLMRISGLFSKRGYNIDNLSVGRTENPEISRMTIVVDCEIELLEQIVQQLKKLVDVVAVSVANSHKCVARELMLVKIHHDTDDRALLEAINVFRGRVVDMATESVVIEITGEYDKLDAFINYVSKFGIIEMSRTGLTALDRGSASLLTNADMTD